VVTRTAGVVELAQLVLTRFGEADRVLHEELQLLRQPPAYNGVILVQSQGTRFARQQYFLHVVCDDATKFLLAGRALPLPCPRFLEPVYFRRSDAHDTRCFTTHAIEPGVYGKQEPTRHEKMQQWFFEPVSHDVFQSRLSSSQ
jgi:hypothetical protein